MAGWGKCCPWESNARAMLAAMRPLDPSQYEKVSHLFRMERPGPLVGQHVLQTAHQGGHGAIFVDRVPHPRAVLARSADNWTLVGDPGAVEPGALSRIVTGMIDAAQVFQPLLERAFSDLRIWHRVILELRREPTTPALEGFEVRPLRAGDAARVAALTSELVWIADTWNGPQGLASTSGAWGAFSKGELTSVAAPFFVGARYEDIGIVTEPAFRGRSLSGACAGQLAQQIRARGRTPSWSTAPDNTASLRVAQKLGFELVRHDLLYVTGQTIPSPAVRAGS